MIHLTDWTTKDEQQIAANTLNKIARKYNMKISTTKTKPIRICGKNIERAKIVIDDTIIEQVTDIIYLGHVISEFKTYYNKNNRQNKINGTIKRHFGKNMLPSTKLR
jgi:hypothetical protein